MPKRPISPLKGRVSHGPEDAAKASDAAADLFIALPLAIRPWGCRSLGFLGEHTGLAPVWRGGIMPLDAHR
jgi:hypothetical protein